jgi:hypothetical protein
VVTKVSYMIKLRNIGASDGTNVTVTNTLAPGLRFIQSVPPPSQSLFGQLTYVFPVVSAGSSKLILIQAELLPETAAGSTLTNHVSVADSGGNSAETSFSGGVRPASKADVGRLTLALTMVRQVVAGSSLRSTIDVNNTGRAETSDVVVTLDGPAAAVFVSGIPGPTSTQRIGDQVRVTWRFPTLRGHGKLRLKFTHDVGRSVPGGTALGFTAQVSDGRGRAASESATVNVRD